MVRFAANSFFALALLVGTGLMTGCDREEEVLDVETPDGEVEVERSTETGELDVETD